MMATVLTYDFMINLMEEQYLTSLANTSYILYI